MHFTPAPSGSAASLLGQRHATDIEAVSRIEAIRTVLRVLVQTTGLRVALVARVTDTSWACCAVLDEANFGLHVGDALDVTTTFCSRVHTSGQPLLTGHASQDPQLVGHPAAKLYGVESYIAVPLHRRDGSSFGVLCALDPRPTDITQDKVEVFRHLAELVGHQLGQEEALGQRDAQLLDANEAGKLREQLIGIVSHDLRSPINAITLSAATLMRRTDLDDRARRAIGRILSSADRAHRLIHDLLDFTHARIGKALPIQRRAMDLHLLTQQVVDEVQLATAGRSIALSGEGPGQGEWDPDRIAQVLTNLLSNAVQYSPPEAAIRVEVRSTEEHTLLTVSNEGPPIPQTLLPNLFEPMTRGTSDGEERRSIGLGLFIVDQIVRSHEGTIVVTSTREAGTAFQIRLPRAAKTAP